MDLLRTARYHDWLIISGSLVVLTVVTAAFHASSLLSFAAFADSGGPARWSGLPARLLIGSLLSLLVAVVSYRLRFLDSSGSVATFVLGVIIFGIGGWPFSAPMLSFFFLSSVLSKVAERRRREISSLFEKSSRRDAGQVLANGGIAAIAILIWHVTGAPLWYMLFLGAVAAVTADTWATEVGILLGRNPRSVINWLPVPAGTSGGITVAGVAGSVAGAFMIAVAGWLVRMPGPAYSFGIKGIVCLTVSGVFAQVLDSVLGATIQAQHVCPVCGRHTERRLHCGGVATRFHSGLRWVNNDVVNALCALGGVVIVFGVLRLVDGRI